MCVNPKTVKIWAAHGLLQAHAYTDKPEHLYEPPGRDAPRKAQGMKLSCDGPQIGHAGVFQRGAV